MAVTRIRIPDGANTRGPDRRLEMSLAETNLAVRTVNCLEDEGILTIKELLQCTPARLLAIPNFGAKTLQTVYEVLEKLGFSRSGGRVVEPQPEGKSRLFSELLP